MLNLSADQQDELLRRFMPVLLVNEDDIGLPVDPATFVARSALWYGAYPNPDDKNDWGTGNPAGNRDPLVTRGALSLAKLPLAENLRAERQAKEFWLDRAGWSGGGDVSADSDNRQAGMTQLRAEFAIGSLAPTLRAEVCDTAAFIALLGSPAAAGVLGMSSNEVPEILGSVVVVLYKFLFPGHAGGGKGVFADGVEYGDLDHEADWTAFAILLRSDNNAPDFNSLTPRFAAFGSTVRGLSLSFGAEGTARRFQVVPWAATPKIREHACVVAANGTHNLYPADIATSPTGAVQPQNISFGFAESLIDDVAAWPQELTETNVQVPVAIAGVTVAKMASGAAVAGPLGALFGLVAGIAEAGSVAKAVGKDPGPPNIDPEDTKPADGDLEDPRDELKEPGEVSAMMHVIGPNLNAGEEQTAVDFLTLNGEVTAVHAWSEQSYARIDRAAERFWPTYDLPAFASGYIGRWGVRCERDPLNRRAGGFLPDFRVELLRRAVAIPGLLTS